MSDEHQAAAEGSKVPAEGDKNALLVCPCGKTPNRLEVSSTDTSDSPKWALVYGDCCAEWTIEFRNQYCQIGSTESQNRAIEAWNAAPRAN